jgi:nucleoside phosphorylase
MRKNIFLHFINRDSREIFELYRFHSDRQHIALLKQALNVSVLLCEEYCVIPPGFAIEDELAFELWEVNRAFLANRLIHLPMRESNLGDYAEKKRFEYSPKRDRYSGLFSDRRLEFLGTNAVGIVPRKTRIGEQIVLGWEAAADSTTKLWMRTKRLVPSPVLEIARNVPSRIADDGIAVTWSEISERLPNETLPAHSELRNSLQNIYFREYCREFNLVVVCELPFASDEFSLRTERAVYSFYRFGKFLEIFKLRELFLGCSAETLCVVKALPGTIEFIDAYQGVARISPNAPDLLLRAQRAVKTSPFKWQAFAARHQLLFSEPEGLAIAELDDALSEIADILTTQNELPQRLNKEAEKPSGSRKRRFEVNSRPQVLLYVALEEELEVLVKRFNLKRTPRNPVATGEIGGLRAAIISPYVMGRVPAAVEMAKYLESRQRELPRLILIVGLAGGFSTAGTKEGHLICVSTVVDLAGRKVQDVDDQVLTRFRRKDYNLDDSLTAVLRAMNLDPWIEHAIKEADWPKDRRPSLNFGPLASVDEVVASSDWQQKLLDSNDKLLGVEMEAGGVCAAADAYRVPVAMLRAVSDNADPIKADTEWRKRGMITIATLLETVKLSDVIESMPADAQ